MSFVLAQQQSWQPDSLQPIPLGPFQSLRNGVTGYDEANKATTSEPKPQAEFFMWEHFTTKPYFAPTPTSQSPPLKKIGEIYTPWPSWMIVASTSTFPTPENDKSLQQLFQTLDQGIQLFEADTSQVVRLLGTGEFGCTYVEDDAKEWLKSVKFAKSTRGVDRKEIERVIDILKVAGVIDHRLGNDDAIAKVVGIHA